MAEERMDEINRLNVEISKLKSSITIDETEIEQLRIEIGKLKAEKFSLLKDKEIIFSENAGLKAAISKLESEKAEIQKRIQSLEAEIGRPKLLPEQLTTSLRDAISKMEEGLKTEGRVDYTVGRFDTDIKASLSVDSENRVFIKLPYIGETITPESLSVIKLSLKAVPKPRAPLIKVPLLIGMSKDSAVQTIQDIGLKASLQERQSKTPPGVVIEQKPEAYTEVATETIIALIVAIPEKVKAPNLINMDKDVAIKIIKEFDLEVGKVEGKLSKVAPDTVIGQAPLPDTEVERGSSVDLVVSVQGIKVPDLKGMKESEARACLEKIKLTIGTIFYRKTLFVGDIVLSQSPEPESEVLPGSAINLTIAQKLSFQELKEVIKSHPEAKKLGVVLDLIFAGLEKLGIDRAEGLRDLLEIPDDELIKKLRLRTKAEVKGFKTVIKRVFEELG
ncbi:MAG TPA: PASTA domain-containing protein [Proteobacteria bacterium]|nr:PASTA domain-containing protein [Pseudomonadota bacterium]